VGRRGSLALATETERAVKALGSIPDVPWAKLPEETRRRSSSASPTSTAKGREEGKPRTRASCRASSACSRPESLRARSEDEDDATRGRRHGRRRRARALRSRVSATCATAAPAPRGARGEASAAATSPTSGEMPLRDAAPSWRRSRSSRRSRRRRRGADDAARDRPVAEPLLRAVVARLGFLIDVGLDYLTLDRSAQTLSGGEGQRIRLATQIGAALVGVLYVLDEPSSACTPATTRACSRRSAPGRSRQQRARGRARSRRDPRRRHVVDMGPGAGAHGGTIVAEGTPAESSWNDPRRHRARTCRAQNACRSPRNASPTTVASSPHGSARAQPPQRRRRDPARLFTAVTGVSGSGKIEPDRRHAPARRAPRSTARPPPSASATGSRASSTSTRSSPSIRRPSAARRARTPRRTRASSRCCASSTRACPRRARAATRRGASRST
jgi:excinuclease ABC subunit A